MEWKLMNGDEKLRREIKRVQDSFEIWFNGYHSKVTTREKMLSDNSPVQHVADKMTKSFEEVKLKYPSECLEMCTCCKRDVTEWIQGDTDVEEYSADVCLCKDCIAKMNELFTTC